jgi:alpha-galactosidase
VVNQLPEKDLAFAKQSVAVYKSISDLVWHGDIYRLADPHESNVASVIYQNKTKTRSVVFTYLTSNRFATSNTIDPIKLKGLDPKKKYAVNEINRYPGTTSPIAAGNIYSGDYLMSVGINPRIDRNRTSVILEFKEAK